MHTTGKIRIAVKQWAMTHGCTYLRSTSKGRNVEEHYVRAPGGESVIVQSVNGRAFGVWDPDFNVNGLRLLKGILHMQPGGEELDMKDVIRAILERRCVQLKRDNEPRMRERIDTLAERGWTIDRHVEDE